MTTTIHEPTHRFVGLGGGTGGPMGDGTMGGAGGNPRRAHVVGAGGYREVHVPAIGDLVTEEQMGELFNALKPGARKRVPAPGQPGAPAKVWGYLGQISEQVNALQEILDGLAIGDRRTHYAGNIAAVSTNQGGNGVAEHVLGTHMKDAGNVRSATGLLVFQAVEQETGPTVAPTKPAFQARAIVAGNVENAQAVIRAEKQITGGATHTGNFYEAGRGEGSPLFAVTKDGAVDAHWKLLLRDIPGSLKNAASVRMTQTEMRFQVYDSAGDASNKTWDFVNDATGTVWRAGLAAIFESPDQATSASMLYSNDEVLGVGVSADAVEVVPGVLSMGDLNGDTNPLVALGKAGLVRDDTLDSLRPSWTNDAGTTSSLALLSDVGGGGDHDVSDTNTASSVRAVSLSHSLSAGGAASGIGVHMDFELEDASANVEAAMRIAAVHTTTTHGSENTDLVIQNFVDGALTEWFRFDASLEVPLIDRYGDASSTTNSFVGYWRALDDANGTPTDGWGGSVGYALQRAASTITNAVTVSWEWSDVSDRDSDIYWTVLQAAGGLELLRLEGNNGTVYLANGILELGDQGTLGTPASGRMRFGFDETADSARPRIVTSGGGEVSLALLSDVGGGGGDHDVSDAGTSNVVDAVDLSHTTSGTPVAGFGVRQTYTLDNELGSPEEVGSIEVLWAGAVGGSTDMEFYSLANGSPTRLFYLDGSELRTVSTVDDANTNAVSIPATVEHTCSGTPTSGFGVGWQFFLENATDGFADYAAQIHAEFGNSAASGSEDVDLVFLVCRDGNWGSSLTEGLRIDADGDGAGGTDTAVLFSTGRADWAQQATSTPPTGRVRASAPDGQVASLMLTTEDGTTGAAVVVIDAQTGASYTGSGSQTSVETFTIPANLLQQDGDSLEIEWTASMTGGVGTTSALAFQVAGTTEFTAGLGATLSNLCVFTRVRITRTGASAARIEARYSEFNTGSAVNDDKAYLATLSNSWASSCALDIDVTHSGGSFTTNIHNWRVTFYPAPR